MRRSTSTLHSPRRSSRAAAAVLALAVVLTACTGGEDDEPDDAGEDPTAAETADVPEAIEADWQQVPVDDDAFAFDDTVDFTGVLARAGRQPAAVYGTTHVQGEGSRATVWSADGEETDLGLPGESSPVDWAVQGGTTYVLGSYRDGDRRTPFLVTSRDRETWEQQTLPDAVAERTIRLTEVAVPESGDPVLLGIDGDDTAVAVRDGEVVDLPAPARGGTLVRVGASASDGERILALATLEADDGRTRLVGYRSDDSGGSWERVLAPGAVRSFAAGMVFVDGTFVVTGQVADGTASAPAAWSSADGDRWVREQVPQLPDHTPGWSAWLGAPTTNGDVVWAGAADEEKLLAGLARRDASGRWTSAPSVSAWIAPGTGASVGFDGNGSVLVARSWNGRGQIGRLAAGGSYSFTANFGASPKVSTWTTAGLLGSTPVLAGSTSTVRIELNGGWNRENQVSRFALDGGEIVQSDWGPRASAGLLDVRTATDPEAGSVVLGTRAFPSDDPGATNESDVVGWFRAGDRGGWRKATGLAGGRTEFVRSVSRVGDRWVAVGIDRASWTANDLYYAAVWTSENGRTWTRETGVFQEGPNLDSWANAACLTSEGATVVVGGAEDPTLGSVPRIWAARPGSGWRTVDVEDLGATTAGLSNCVSTGETTLVQGSGPTRDVTFSTVDAVSYTPVEIGAERDFVGQIKRVGVGFAAAGSVDVEGTTQPVVWLSADGTSWQPAPVPTERDVLGSLVVDQDGTLVVPLISSSGPEVWSITNAEELVAGAG